jgi:hypothetical protein
MVFRSFVLAPVFGASAPTTIDAKPSLSWWD